MSNKETEPKFIEVDGIFYRVRSGEEFTKEMSKAEDDYYDILGKTIVASLSTKQPVHVRINAKRKSKD